MLENILPDKKTVKNTEINPENRKKTLQKLIEMFLKCFWANM